MLRFIVPHGHRDRVVKNKCPYQTKDQLQFTVHNICTVCNTTIQGGSNVRIAGKFTETYVYCSYCNIGLCKAANTDFTLGKEILFGETNMHVYHVQSMHLLIDRFGK